jgi:hypothetical protein
MEVILKAALLFVLISLVCALPANAEKGFEGRPITNNLWSPTGNTLNKHEFSIGLGSIQFGITDNVQLGTNVLLYLLQIYNADLKVNLYKTSDLSFSAGLGYGRFDLSALANDDVADFTTISPFASISKKISPGTTLHLSGRYSHFTSNENIDDFEVEEGLSGTEIMGGIEYSLSNKTKFLADVGYDFTWDGVKAGGGVLFGWDTFRLKLGVNYFKPESRDYGFTLPVIGLWWRFNG